MQMCAPAPKAMCGSSRRPDGSARSASFHWSGSFSQALASAVRVRMKVDEGSSRQTGAWRRSLSNV